MNATLAQLPRKPRTNPFSTRFVRPGALPFIFPDRCDGASLVAGWQSQSRRGAIVGPHGSGKSTLLATLIPALEQAGERVLRVDLHDGERSLPRDVLGYIQSQRATTIVVDGYEQLTWLNRKQLVRACDQAGAGLLVTSHSDVGIPVLFRTAIDLRLAQQVVACLIPASDSSIDCADVRRAFRLHGDNLREALFALYDVYEERAACTAGGR